ISPKKISGALFIMLLSNAIKYRSPDRIPEIHLKTERVDGHIQLSVKDNGLGIAEDKRDQLFQPYSRIEKKAEGTRIGLYLVKKIIENEGEDRIEQYLWRRLRVFSDTDIQRLGLSHQPAGPRVRPKVSAVSH